MKSLAPLVLFVYNRLSETKQTIEALQHNFLASESELFIFSDGPKNKIDFKNVKKVRDYIKTIKGFKKVTIFESDINKGLANSIISGVTKIIKKYIKVIVLEDDLITAPNFLDFMNQALDFYENDEKIFSISGYTMDLPSLRDYSKDYYLGYRASSWGWATWKNRWENVDWGGKVYGKFKLNPILQLKFMRGGSDMSRMLKNQMNGKIDSWAIRWCFNQFLNKQFTVFPSKSKVQNIGFNDNATHTKNGKRFKTTLDNTKERIFSFEKNIKLNKGLIIESRKPYSFYNRIKNKLT